MKCFACLILSLHFTAAISQPVAVPFFLIGNTIFVEAAVNGESGNFIVDTGAPKMFLNSNRFQGMKIPWQNDGGIVDVNGHNSAVAHYIIKEISVSGYRLRNDYALVTDLSNLEKSKGIPVAGILGYPVFTDMEVLFDFDNQQLLLFPLDRKGRRTCATTEYTLVDSFEMKMNGHFPCITANLDGRELSLGIDSGAEVNLLHQSDTDSEAPSLKAESSIVLTGMENRQKVCRTGKIAGLKVGHMEMGETKVVLTDLDYLNAELRNNLDGMLGAPFLMRGKMAINYKKKMLYVWQDVENGLAAKTRVSKEIKPTASGLK